MSYPTYQAPYGASYTVQYLKKDGYLEQSTTGTPTVTGYIPATDTSYYDAFGRRTAVSQTSDSGSGVSQTSTRVFAYDTNGEILQRRSGTASDSTFTPYGGGSIDHYAYVEGQQVGMLDEGGGIHVLDTLTGFSDGPSTQGYVVQAGDTLAGIAQAVYGNSQYGYLVADANGMTGDDDLVVGQAITLPSISTSANTSSTFKPYNPNEIVGSTTPSLPATPPPPPSQAGCSGLAQIVMIVVIIVASIYTAGAATAYFEMANAAAAAAAGGTAAAVAAAGSAASLTIGESIAIGAIAGAAGSAAGQLAGDALGIHQGFSLGELAVSAAGGAIGGGLSSAFSGSGEFAGTFGSSTGNGINIGGNAIIGASSYAGSYEVAKLTGQATHFSWAGLVESAVGSAAAGKVGPTQEQAQSGDQSGTFWTRVEANATQDVVQRETGALLGDHHIDSWKQVAEDVFGNALGNAAVVGINAERQQQWSDELSQKVDASAANVDAVMSARMGTNGQGAMEGVDASEQDAFDATFDQSTNDWFDAHESVRVPEQFSAQALQTYGVAERDGVGAYVPFADFDSINMEAGLGMPNYTFNLSDGVSYTLPHSLMQNSYINSRDLGQSSSVDDALSYASYKDEANNLSSLYADLMNRDLSFQDKWNVSQSIPGMLTAALTFKQGYPFNLDGYMDLYARNASLQRSNNLFDPSSSVLYVHSYPEAGAVLSSFAPSASNALSVNPISIADGGNVVSRSGIFGASNFKNNGYEQVGTIYVVDGDKFKVVAEAYAAVMQQSNGGLNADSLITSRDWYSQEVPTHTLANGALAVSGNAMDAASFLTEVASYSKNFRNYGQVNVYIKENQMYFEVVSNNYNTNTNAFQKFNPPTSNATFQEVYQGLHHGY